MISRTVTDCYFGPLVPGWGSIGQLFDAFRPTECANYLAHAGYVPSTGQLLSTNNASYSYGVIRARIAGRKTLRRGR
jgi:hypothetical protein